MKVSEYQYTSLQPQQIRLITIFPGRFKDDVYLGLDHVDLEPTETAQDKKRLPKRTLQQTLPENWKVYETLEGKYLFSDVTRSEVQETHPDPDIDPELYASAGKSVTAAGLEYDALSYVWGSKLEYGIVYIQVGNLGRTSSWGQESVRRARSQDFARKTLRITKSLLSALRHLRYENERRRIWIDAICINQNDTIEREIQVTRMSHIYGLANQVIVWLGPETNQTKRAFGSIKRLAEQSELTVDNCLIQSPNANKPESICSNHYQHFSDEEWRALTSLFQNPWFRRVWTMQEIRLAGRRARILWGTHLISIYHLQTATAVLSWRKNLPTELQTLTFQAVDVIAGRRLPPLPMLLDSSSMRGCADQRDKIYGVLSLAPAWFARQIQPDYSLSMEALYLKVMLSAMKVLERLELLPDVVNPNPDFNGPSWVPDWRFNSRILWPLADHFQAAGVSKASYSYQAPGTLELAGVMFSSVASVSRAFTKDKSQVVNLLQDLEPHDMLNGVYPTGESLFEAYLRTLYLSQLSDRYPSFPHITFDRWAAIFSRHIGRHASSPDFKELPDNVLEFLDRGSFLTLDNKYFGIGLAAVEPGDIVCVFLGCYSPMIIRPTGPDHYNLVGKCYIHGIMNGEALLGPLPHPWTVQQLQIDHYYVSQFVNPITNTRSTKDPRLGPLPSDWVPIDRQRTAADPLHYAYFENKVTKNRINSDPRLLPEFLVQRGVKLQTIRLV